MERAATEPLQDRKTAAAVATEAIRKIPSSTLRLSEKNGIAYHTLRARLRKGWEPNRAATQPILTLQQIGRIGANNVRAIHGDVNRIFRSGKWKATRLEKILPAQYPR